MGEIDANTLEANAIKNAWGYKTQAVNQRNQALTSRSAASSISPGTAAMTSLIGSGSQVAAGWYRNQGGAQPQQKMDWYQ
jgi:hypothetical protein